MEDGLRDIAERGSLAQLQAFLEQHPNQLNEYFTADRGMMKDMTITIFRRRKDTLLTYACTSGNVNIVKFLLSVPNINVNKSVDYTPLDLALRNEHVNIVLMLLARKARLARCDKNQLDEYLRKEKRKAEEQKKQVAEEMKWEAARKREEEKRQMEEEKRKVEETKLLGDLARSWTGTLREMSDDVIRQELNNGHLVCRFSDRLAWTDIEKRVEKHEIARAQHAKSVDTWREEQATIEAQCQDVQSQLARLEHRLSQLRRQYETIEQRIRDYTKDPPKNFADDLQFARQVKPIEQRLVAQLEEEMSKEKPQLSALSDNSSSQPKLSLLLNCMGVKHTAIAATGALDSATFKRLTKRPDFSERYRSMIVSAGDVMDLLYCGEMMRDSDFPFENHEIDCVVCANQSTQQLINFIRERPDINLPVDVLTSKNINGRRILYCAPSDFPGQDKQQVMNAVDRLRELHEDAM